MKNIFKYISLLTISLVLFQSCEEGDTTIDYVLDNVNRGATLRTMNLINGTVNVFDIQNSVFEVELEYRDNEDGVLFDSYDVYATFTDNTADGVDNSKPEVFLRNVGREQLPVNPEFGFPRGVLQISAPETLAALGLTEDQLNGGDVFNYRLVLKLTDGREFTNKASGTVTGGSFFSSPFEYNAPVVCLFDEPDFFSGTYLIEQLNGTDPFYGEQTFGTQTVNIAADGISRTFDFVFYPSSFQTAYSMKIDLICGDILVTGTGGLGCGAGIGQSTGTPVSNFDLNFEDDDVIEINVEDFNPDGNCGTGSYQMTLRFTKQ